LRRTIKTHRGFKRLIGTVAFLLMITGCQAMTGETMGQNIDVTLSRVGVETNNGVVYLTGEVETAEQKSHIGSIASQVKGVKQVVNNLQVIKR
jgi:virulence-associated protein VapD